MELKKTKIGVCLDHTIAYLLEEKDDENRITIIRADDDLPKVESSADRHQRNREFVQKIYELVKDYDLVSVFGTASARRDLIRKINAEKDHEIEVRDIPVGKGSNEDQRIEFISSYFAE